MPPVARTPPVGQVIKARRKELNLTLADLGAALGLANGNFIGMVERGERMPADDRLLALAKALDLDGRELVAMKYRQNRRSAVDILLTPPEPHLPRLRRYLLSVCTNREEMTTEFEASSRGAAERIVFHTLLVQSILPAIERDRHAPRRLRDRVLKHRERGQPGLPEARWFEDEAALFVSWALGQSVVRSWTLDLLDLEIRVVDSDDKMRRFSLVPTPDRVGGARSKPALDDKDHSPSLDELLRAEELSDEDVAEILDLVEWKKSRSKRSKQRRRPD